MPGLGKSGTSRMSDLRSGIRGTPVLSHAAGKGSSAVQRIPYNHGVRATITTPSCPRSLHSMSKALWKKTPPLCQKELRDALSPNRGIFYRFYHDRDRQSV